MPRFFMVVQVAISSGSWQRVLPDKAAVARGEKAGAVTEYQAGLAIAQRLVAKDSKNADWSKQAASFATKVATCCGMKGTKPPR